MKFFKTFHKPIYKIGASSDQDIIEVGDDVYLVLRDNSETKVQAATVEKGGRRIGWQISGEPVDYTGTSAQDATTVASDDTTGDALANALKAAYNLARADVVTIFNHNEPLGSPTATANSTTAASSDGTRLALANALRTNLLALRVDVVELQTNFPELVSPVPEIADFAPVGSDDATTQTLLNNLQGIYNDLQTAIQEALDKLETGGYYQPRSEDVIAVGGLNQFACPPEEDSEYASLHDGPEDDGAWEHVVNPNAAVMRAPATLRETSRKPAEATGKKAEAQAAAKLKKSAKKIGKKKGKK